MLDFIYFMFFSTIEGLAIYALSLYIFRIDFKRYLWHSLIIIEIINLQNHLTRLYNVDDAAAAIAPIINLLITMLFFKVVVRLPLLQSLVMVITGFFGFVALQTALIFSIFQGTGPLDDPVNGYIIQFLSGAIGVAVSNFLYRKGFGFTFDFEKLKFSGEHVLVIALICLFIIGVAFMMFYQNLFLNLIGFLVGFLLFLYYSIRKEKIHGI